MNFKQKAHKAFMELLQKKINLLEMDLADLKESGSHETKSTAGDKHETALAMLQIEQENKRKQLADMMQQYAVLGRINPELMPASIVNGSLIETDKGWFLLCVALGKITCEGKIVYALSADSPLGQKLKAAKINDLVLMNNVQYRIVSLQ